MMKKFQVFLTLLIVTILNLAKSENLGFKYTSYDIKEKQSITIDIMADVSSTHDCEVFTSSPHHSRINIVTPQITFHEKIQKRTVILEALENAIPCDTVTVQLLLQCDQSLDTPFVHASTKLSVIDASMGGGACNDPHLTQDVKALDEFSDIQIKKLCYDLYGKSGDQFEIISDSILDASVVIQLRDDFYIGKIFLQGPFGTIEVNTTHITTHSKIKFSWNDRKHVTFGKEEELSLKLEGNKNYVSLNYEKFSRVLNVQIVKIKQDYGKYYLNILVGKEMGQDGVFDKFHRGIFGEIANKNYEFYSPIQENENHVAMKINGRYVKSWLKRHETNGEEKCYTTSLNNLLFPKTLKDFKKSI